MWNYWEFSLLVWCLLILYCLAAQTFPQSSSSPKGRRSAYWHVYPWTELLRHQSKIIYPSLQSVPIGYITKHHILKSHYQSFPCHLLYLSILLVFFLFITGAPSGQQPRVEGDGPVPIYAHTRQWLQLSAAVFTSTLHKHHRKSSIPIHTYCSSLQYGS